MPIEDGGPAFAFPSVAGLPNGEVIYGHNGMSLRDYFAAHALNGLLASHSKTAADHAQDAYELADAMIARRSKGVR